MNCPGRIAAAVAVMLLAAGPAAVAGPAAHASVAGPDWDQSSQVTLTPPAQSLTVGDTAELTANVSTATGPVSGASVAFSVNSGPDAGTTFTGTTDLDGNAAFSYTDTTGPGTDSVSATYTDASNQSQMATATVTWNPPPATVTTSLSGGGMSGTSISVPGGTAVTDAATLSGVNASIATGSVTYYLYSNEACTTLVGSAGPPEDMTTAGKLPTSVSVTLNKPGTYYWQALYSGDTNNQASRSTCGTGGEVETVTGRPSIDRVSSAKGRDSVTVNVSTTAAGDLLVAFVTGKGPQGKRQTSAVSSGGLKWTFMGREDAGRGDAEVWSARAVGTLHKLHVNCAGNYKGWDLAITVVAFKNAAGIAKVTTSHGTSGAPKGQLTTSKINSWVFAVGDDWLNSALRTAGSGQAIVSQSTGTQHDTSWVQARTSITPKAGTMVTINDTKPTADPYDMVLIDIF